MIVRHRGDAVQIHRCRQHPAAVVVGMVTHDLGAPRRADEQFAFAAKACVVRIRQMRIPFLLIDAAIQGVQFFLIACKYGADIHMYPPPYTFLTVLYTNFRICASINSSA